jgi:RND family efflux transporter MFP subunit
MALATSGCSEETDKVDLPGQQASAGEKPTEKPNEKPTSEQADEQGAEEAPEQLADSKSAGRRLSGSFEPQRTSAVAASVGGIIRQVYVDEGDTVEKGDRLINIDAQDYQLRVEQARAAVKAAQAQVDTLKTEYDRTARLLKQEAVPQAQADQLSGNLAAARAQLEQAKVGLRMAQKARADAVVSAPYAGVITAVNVAEGSFAAPGPSPLVQLEEVQNLYLRVSVPEEYAGDVQIGDTLTVRVPSLERTMKLAVSRINPTVGQGSRSFDVLAEVENPNLEIRSGMFAEITLAEDASGGGPTDVAGSQNPDAQGSASTQSDRAESAPAGGER